MTGQRFGRLLVVEPVRLEVPDPGGTRLRWKCLCDCGKEILITRKELMSGKAKSCGCYLAETAKETVAQKVQRYKGTSISKLNSNEPNKRNKLGIRGVYWSSSEEKYVAHITLRKKKIVLGKFTRLEDAIAARKRGEEMYFQPIIEEYGEISRNNPKK